MSLYQVQKEINPKVEDVISDYLDGEMKRIALDFIAFLRTNKMNPAWTLTNLWKVT